MWGVEREFLFYFYLECYVSEFLCYAALSVRLLTLRKPYTLPSI